MGENAGRRQFFLRAAQGAGAAACAGLGWNALLAQQAHAAPFALRPPGAQQERDFGATCIKCGSCVVACPFHTLRLASTASAVPVGTPHFLPREEPCHLCPDIPCAKACPTGALDREMKDIAGARMGLAVVDAENCLSWNGLRCEVCYRVCPVKGKAITIEPHPRLTSKHAVFVPHVHSRDCTGCGLCERACPTGLAAIRILPPALVQGRIGDHYRMDWREPPASPPAAAPEAAPAAPAPRAPAGTRAPGIDYLNAQGLP